MKLSKKETEALKALKAVMQEHKIELEVAKETYTTKPETYDHVIKIIVDSNNIHESTYSILEYDDLGV